jgi:two-component system chemotaxis sensor kinase CheA
MDVVKRNIEALKGEIDIQSVSGEGTVVRLRMPLTLAIIDGFRVGVGASAFVIPLDLVIECLDLTGAQASTSQYLNLRGEVLPFLRLRELFEIDAPPPARQAVVVVQYGMSRAGLVVDRLEGELHAVIKPLGQLFRGVKGLSGSTILGSGAVALILDVPDLIQRASVTERQRVSRVQERAPRRLGQIEGEG